MDKTPNIYQRVSAVMADIAFIQKEDKRVNNQYTFVSHDAVSAKLHPLLVKHGIVTIPRVIRWTQDGNRTAVDVEVDFVNIDAPDDRFTVPCFGYGIDPQDKGPGKAMSYATKYAMLKTFVLETGDDPERDNIDHVGETAETLKAEALTALDKGDWPALWEIDRREGWVDAWKLLGSKDRSAIKKLQAKRDEYRDHLNTAALHDDLGAIEQLTGEMNEAEKKCVWHSLSEEARDVIRKLKETKEAA